MIKTCLVFLVFLIAASGMAMAEEAILDVYVPVRPLSTGEIIAQGDLQLRSVPERDLSSNAVVDLKSLVGMEVKRTLKEGAIIRKNAIAAPILVHKKELVTLTLETNQMRLTAQGQAMDDGAMGEVIRVMNLTSKKVISAVVSGKQAATVVVEGTMP
ncbi:MAG: flagellar basal body P-ring formation chaperone FlgA [Alphaproteobacteria bacterium]